MDAAKERANYQLFLTELAALLGVDKPDPGKRRSCPRRLLL